jgi:Tfp pilus assembly protein PilO
MINKNIFNKKMTDYTYLVMFFLFFSFSILFIIRPTLVTLFSLKKELFDLENVNKIYDDKIINFSQLQQYLETNRDKLIYLKEAVPDKPNLNKIIDDLYKSASISGLTFKRMSAPEVNLKEEKEKKYNTVVFNIETVSDFNQMMVFLENLSNQRRLKSIQKLLVSRNQEGSPSAQLKVEMKIEVGYL